MDNKYLKKIIAQSPEDLNIISACCSEGVVNIKDIKYLTSNRIFLISISRFSKEEENKSKIINSIIKFEFINSSKSKNIDQKDDKIVLELLTIEILKRDGHFEITILFSKNRIITLSAEVIEVTLEDQKFINDKSNRL